MAIVYTKLWHNKRYKWVDCFGLMVLSELRVERYAGKDSGGFYSCCAKIGSKEFSYFRSRDGREIEKWEDNFDKAYFLDDGNGGRNIVALSTEGVSVFGSGWKNRKDFVLERRISDPIKTMEVSGYRALEGLAERRDLMGLENAFLKFVLD